MIAVSVAMNPVLEAAILILACKGFGGCQWTPTRVR
jgi:hypothetical protein